MVTKERCDFFLMDSPGTHNPSLIVLRDKGYELGVLCANEEVEGGPELFGWCAAKGKNYFEADDPLRLLGLVSLWEHRGENWRNDSDDNVFDELLTDLFGCD